MSERYEIELEPEVREWLDALPIRHYLRVMQRADELADSPETFGEPRSRHSLALCASYACTLNLTTGG